MPSIVPSREETITIPTSAVKRRDLSIAPFRYPPEPRYSPLEFYNAVSRSDSEQLAKILATDAFFITQDNGAGSPLHFATTHARLDMVHHLLNLGAPINQRDFTGCTALHRAARLAQHPGYLEIYELLLVGQQRIATCASHRFKSQSRGADPSIISEDFEPYLNPGRKRPADLQPNEAARAALLQLEARYQDVPKAPAPHPSVGDWWTLYDYGLEAVLGWHADQDIDFPEDVLQRVQSERAAKARALRATRRADLFAGKDVAPLHTPVALLFPGQGSQVVGMLKASRHLPAVKAMLATASSILGYDLESLCLQGPPERLDATEYCQPAMLVANLAAVELLRSTRPDVVAQVSAVGGLSVGEYAALCHAGVLRFEDALQVVQVRGQAMAAAARDGKHGMLSVVGMPDKVLLELCEEARGAGGVCEVANRLFPQGRVVSGDEALLQWLEGETVKRGALKTRRLAVSGAFHTQRMAPARAALEHVLRGVEVQAPRIVVYSNVTGKPLVPEDDVRGLLARQVVEPVQWERTLKALLASGKRELYEVGPGKQIKSMVRRIDERVEVVGVQP